ncbi:MAG: hypothetical protein EAX86_04045 [Candidatus Heimdallarchaeota archaeon]|nr:hypothetical protein [Candidatus Heimdallarchaeota archaeon]
MKKDALYILVGAAILIIIGIVGIVILGDENSAFADLNLSTGFGLIPDTILGLPIGWVASGLLLVIAVILFYVFVWKKKE